MTLSLGIDIGTSGIKTATINSKEEIFSISNIGHIKQNSNKINPSIWWETVKYSIKMNLINLSNKGINSFEIKKNVILMTQLEDQLSLKYYQQHCMQADEWVWRIYINFSCPSRTLLIENLPPRE